MMVQMLIPLFIVSLCSPGKADECGNWCKFGEQCLTNGTCVDRSKLVDCVAHYCLKGQSCCGLGCMPDNKVCCSIAYCDLGHACCGGLFCCKPGFYCDAGDCKRCVGGDCTTNNPTTKTIRTTPARTYVRTRYVRTTPRQLTTRISVTTVHRLNYSGRFLWWHGVIISSVFIIVALIIGLFRWYRRTTGSNRSNVLSGPSQPINYTYAVATNTGLSPNNLHTGPIGVGYTAYGTRANVLPQRQYLMVTQTGVPPYNIHSGYSADGNTKSNGQGRTGQVPVNNVHQMGTHTVDTGQNIAHVQTKI